MPAVKNGEVVVQVGQALPDQDVTVRRGTRETAIATPVRKAEQVGTVAAAAEVAAEQYAPDELEQHARALADAWATRLKFYGQKYARQLRQAQQESTEPVTNKNYAWWNVLLAGPFQFAGSFRPNKVIMVNEPAFMIAALWRNPTPIPGNAPLTPANVMSAYKYSLWCETLNLSTCADGPDFGDFVNTFGGGNINFEFIYIPAGTFTAQSGRPTLYEMNLVVDILGPGAGLPAFAGYATWVLDPDDEPPFMGIPGQGPRLQHDIPARFAVYV